MQRPETIETVKAYKSLRITFHEATIKLVSLGIAGIDIAKLLLR
jgi:hypothetical protein